MSKKTLTFILLGMSLLLASCVDKTYDLAKKDISTDVKLEDNKIALPVGSLKPIVLGDLIDVEKIEMLEQGTGGVYSISMNDEISVEESVEPVELEIEQISHTVEIDFTEPEIKSIQIEPTALNQASFRTPDVSFSELKLTPLQSNVSRSVTNDYIDAALKLLAEGNVGDIFPDGISVNEEVRIENEVVRCKCNYTLPAEVERINSIKLGTLVEIAITHPKALSGVDKTVNFEIVFPDNFLLSKAFDECEISDDRHTISVVNLKPAKDSKTYIKFYIDELGGLGAEGEINFDKVITYSIAYEVDGKVFVDKSWTSEDFKFNVAFDVPLNFCDVSGKTKDIEVPFNEIAMSFDTHIDNLKNIEYIKYVEFDNENSSFKFETPMSSSDWLDEFALAKGYALKIAFPESLYFDDKNSVYKGKGSEIVYDEAHAFSVYDLKALCDATWSLALDRLDVEEEVEDGVFNKKTEFSVYAVDASGNKVDHLLIEGTEFESIATTLDKLKGTKTVKFNILPSEISVEDAEVQTSAITSEIKTKKEFLLDEKVTSEIRRINSINFGNEVAVKFDMELSGLDCFNTDVHLDLEVTMPSFLKLVKSDRLKSNTSSVKIDIKDDMMYITADYHTMSREALSFELLCTGIDFGYAGLQIKDSIDGNSYISHSDSIVVVGSAVIDDMELHYQDLENMDDIEVDLNVEISKMQISKFHGIYSKELPSIDEKIELDLGDDLDFLKDPGNSITLANPQVEFVLTNTIGVPVDIELQIVGSDENGVNIGEPIKETLSILPAEYDEKNDVLIPVETKFFLTTDINKNSKGDGYTPVEISDLANLLQEIPHEINFKVNPKIKTDDVTHHVDISAPIKLYGSYSVVIPLEFEDMHLSYEETIDGLQGDIGETLEMFSAVSLAAKMDVFNTLPLGLVIKMTPYDAADKIIEDIEIADLVIKAGSGANILDGNGVLTSGLVPQSFVFEISSKTGDFSALDKLVMSVEATSNNTTGSAGLASGQGLKISNLVFEISGDLEVDLSK